MFYLKTEKGQAEWKKQQTPLPILQSKFPLGWETTADGWVACCVSKPDGTIQHTAQSLPWTEGSRNVTIVVAVHLLLETLLSWNVVHQYSCSTF